MSQGQRRLAAIMFTDMVGYTALSQRNESLSLELVEEQRRLIRPILSRNNGREIKTMGDAFLVLFPNALDAVRCAYAIQDAARQSNSSLPEDRKIRLRIGVHIGDVVEDQGDVSGDAVNVASRIEPLAEEGGVCVSRAVYDQTENKFEHPFRSLGQKELKNVARPLEVYKVVLPWQETTPPQGSQADKKRIAVLPLANISHDPSDEYFAEGMTEELINALSHVQGLKVIARTSVARYKTNPKPISEIAKELGVGTVMEGSVRKAGDRVRVTAQLIDAASEEHLWSENYDRKVEDIFAIQSDVAGMVAESLKTKLLEGDRKQLESGYTGNPEAYDKYLLARYSKTRDPLAKVRYYQEALELDPNFALAHAELANYYVEIAGDFVTPKDAFSKAKGHIDRALELNDHLARAWRAKSNFELQYEWDLEKAEASIKRAVELDPGDANALGWYAVICLKNGRNEEAIQLASKGRAIDPYPSSPPLVILVCHALARRDEDVARQCARMKELYPGDPDTPNDCALAYGLIKKTQEAVRELDLLRGQIRAHREMGLRGYTAGVGAGFYSINAMNYAIQGRTETIRSMIEEAEEAQRTEFVGSSQLGTLYLAAGELDRAEMFLTRSVEERDAALFLYSVIYARMVAQLPNLEEIRLHPKLAPLLRRFGII